MEEALEGGRNIQAAINVEGGYGEREWRVGLGWEGLKVSCFERKLRWMRSEEKLNRRVFEQLELC